MARGGGVRLALPVQRRTVARGDEGLLLAQAEEEGFEVLDAGGDVVEGPGASAAVPAAGMKSR
jgi:hypothetical protein